MARQKQLSEDLAAALADLPDALPAPVDALVADPDETPVAAPVAVPAVTFSPEQFTAMLQALTAQQAAGGSKELDLALAAITQLKSEVERTVTRSNARHPGISAFSYPEGDVARPKPALKYETYFCGQLERHDSLTPLEIDLYNAFTKSTTSRNGSWSATIDQNGTKTRLMIKVPAQTIDDLASLPPLTAILSELLYGTEAVDPNLTAQTILALQQKVAALEAQVGARV